MNRLKEESRLLEQVLEYSLQYRNVRSEEARCALQYLKENKKDLIMLQNDKKFIAYKNEILKSADGVSAKQSSLMIVLEKVLASLDLFIWKTDSDGEIVRDKDGNPKVDWVKAIFNIGKIVGSFYALKETYEKE